MNNSSGLAKALSVFAILAGTMIIALGILSLQTYSEFVSESEAVMAVVIDAQTAQSVSEDVVITPVEDGIVGKILHPVYFQFHVGAEQHVSTADVFLVNHEVGETLQIFYKIYDPTDCRLEYNTIAFILAMIFGVYLFIRGGSTFYFEARERSKVKNLMIHEKPVPANILEIYEDHKFRLSRKKPYRIRLYRNNKSGKKDIYISEPLWESPLQVIRDFDMETLPVFIHEKHADRYYVDLSPLDNPVRKEGPSVKNGGGIISFDSENFSSRANHR